MPSPSPGSRAWLHLPLSGSSQEPVLQRRRKAGLVRSCSSLLFPPEPPEVTVPAVRRTAAPPAGKMPNRDGPAARSGSTHRKSLPLTPPEAQPVEDPALSGRHALTANEVTLPSLRANVAIQVSGVTASPVSPGAVGLRAEDRAEVAGSKVNECQRAK